MYRSVKRSGRIALWLTMVILVIVVVPLSIAIISGGPTATTKQAAPPLTAQQKIEAHLVRLDQSASTVADQHVERIRGFFRERKGGAKGFAEWPYSWTGKWYVLKGKVQGDEGAAFRAFLSEKFGQHVFKTEELQAVLESALAGYLAETQGLENDMLVQLRADLADGALFGGNLPQLQSDQLFQQEYQRLSEEILPKVVADMKIFVAGQATSFVGSEFATATIGRSLAARLGLSSGFLGTAARWGLVTFGVGMVSWFILDYVVDWILQLVGHNPADELARKVEQGLDRIESQLIEGDQGAVANYQRLRQQERDDASPENQLQCRQEADRIEESGVLGVRYQLQKLQELQSRLRREALHRLAVSPAGS